MGFGGEFLSEVLTLPSDAISYDVSRRIASEFPDEEFIEGIDGFFDLQKYAAAGGCYVEVDEAIHSQVFVSSAGDAGVHREPQNIAYRVNRKGTEFKVLLATFQLGMCRQTHFWIVAATRSEAEALLLEVCSWNAEVRDEVLVFDGGEWRKDPALFESIQGSSFENLILPERLKRQIRDDSRRFIGSRETYSKFNIPWKRGMVFVGPPGNGKTHCIKSLVNELKLPCLYVKSLTSQYQSDQECIGDVFARARKTAPCLLVFEDLDALINDANRSYFLNEVDGFADNSGIICVATTNHPEKLDPAIIDRPSRFDRKYHFHLPDTDLRRDYLSYWNERLDPELRMNSDELALLAERTGGFSFAYLKELISSSLVDWMGREEREKLVAIMAEQEGLLRMQMRSESPSSRESGGSGTE